MSVSKPTPQQPGLLWRAASTFVMASAGVLWRGFLYGLNDVEVVGLDKFLALLDERRDVGARKQGLLTVSNHVSVIDDPLVWGVLPFRYTTDPRNLRWSLGSYDICYKNSFTSYFFFAGQTLPTHRLRHSPFGGLFQPTMNQAVRLLSAPSTAPASALTPSPFSSASPSPTTTSHSSFRPVSAAASAPLNLYYSTNGVDRWPAPSAFASNRHAWVHIYPEGMIHQTPAMEPKKRGTITPSLADGASPSDSAFSTTAASSSAMSSSSPSPRGVRYFKWGVARLLLESEPAPAVVPMFVDGPDRVMDEERGFPRFLPRVGQRIRIVFGDALAPDAFADLRARWRALVAASKNSLKAGPDLRYGPEAEQLRIETARRVREAVMALRRQCGYPEEDPTHALAETWASDPDMKRYRSTVDNSIVYQE